LFFVGWISLVVGACNTANSGDPDAESSVRAEAPRRDIVSVEENQYSQHGEELIIRDFFQDRRGGVFLDVGAAWPVHYSNTYYLERELDWSGIAVDAFADHARRWRNRRPKSTFVNFIVTDHSGGVETFHRALDTNMIGISTLTPEEGLGPATEFEEVQVPTITLTDLLDQAGVSKIDLLSMDIEGHELAALAGFDIDRFKPELVCIEVHAAARQPVTEFFAAHGYERLERYDEHDFANYYFTPARATAGR